MKEWMLLFFLGLMVQTANAKVYTWMDEQGIQHFSDKPKEGSEEVKLKPIQSLSWEKSPEFKLMTPDVIKKKSSYKSLTIISPEPDAYIRDNHGMLPIKVGLEPELIDGHVFQAYLDGEPIGDKHFTNKFYIEGIYRGEHSLVIKVEKESGDVVMQSDPVPFHMWRNIILKNRPQAIQDANP